MVHGDYTDSGIDITIDEFAREGVFPVEDYFMSRLAAECDRHAYPTVVKNQIVRSILDKV